jgi:hypothetical protein
VAYVHIPRRQIDQPFERVKLRSNALDGRIWHAFVPSVDGTLFDVVTGAIPTRVSGQSYSSAILSNGGGYSGEPEAFVATAGSQLAGNYLPPNTSPADRVGSGSSFTLLVLGGSVAPSSAGPVMCGVWDPLVTGTGFSLAIDDNWYVGPGRLRASVSSGMIMPNPVRNTLNFFGCAYQGGNDIRFYAQGASSVVTSSATISNPNQHQRVFIGNPGDGSTINCQYGAVALALFVDGVVSDDEYAELYASPWQIFKADPIRFYSLASGGIPTLTALTASNITQTGVRATLTLTR